MGVGAAGATKRPGSHFRGRSGKWEKECADLSEKSVELRSFMCQTGLRTEFSGRARGRTQSLGRSGMLGALAHRGGGRRTGGVETACGSKEVCAGSASPGKIKNEIFCELRSLPAATLMPGMPPEQAQVLTGRLRGQVGQVGQAGCAPSRFGAAPFCPGATAWLGEPPPQPRGAHLAAPDGAGLPEPPQRPSPGDQWQDGAGTRAPHLARRWPLPHCCPYPPPRPPRPPDSPCLCRRQLRTIFLHHEGSLLSFW